MKTITFCFAFLSAQICGANSDNDTIAVSPSFCGHHFQTQVVGGTNAQPGEDPWIALIGYKDVEKGTVSYACSGTLINARYVLSSASCLFAKHPEKVKRLDHVRLGEYNINTRYDCLVSQSNRCLIKLMSIDVLIEEIIAHPSYKKRGLHSDNIGLVRLKESLDFEDYNGFINPICLPPAGADPRILFPGYIARTVGWDFGSGHPNEALMVEMLRLVNDSMCEAYYRGYDHKSQICMMSVLVRKRCVADSGSPLTLAGPRGPPLLQIGLESFSPFLCANSQSPSVYTSIGYYMEWIESTMHI